MKRIMCLAILVFGVGCRGWDSVREDKEEGTVVVYPGLTKDKALEVAKWVMKDKGADKLQVTGEWIKGEWHSNLVSWGAYCGFYPRESKEGCEVRVITRRKSAISIFTGITEAGFITAFEGRLQ